MLDLFVSGVGSTEVIDHPASVIQDLETFGSPAAVMRPLGNNGRNGIRQRDHPVFRTIRLMLERDDFYRGKERLTRRIGAEL